jgi:hypothetical protein
MEIPGNTTFCFGSGAAASAIVQCGKLVTGVCEINRSDGCIPEDLGLSRDEGLEIWSGALEFRGDLLFGVSSISECRLFSTGNMLLQLRNKASFHGSGG